MRGARSHRRALPRSAGDAGNMGRQGGKGQPPRSKRAGGGGAPPPRPSADDAEFEVDEEDIAFIQSHKRQLSFLSRAALDDDAPGCARPRCALFVAVRCCTRRPLLSCRNATLSAAATASLLRSGSKRRAKRVEAEAVEEEEAYERAPRVAAEWAVRPRRIWQPARSCVVCTRADRG